MTCERATLKLDQAAISAMNDGWEQGGIEVEGSVFS